MRQSGLRSAFWLPDFFDCSRIHPLAEFFLKLRSNTHFEKTPFDARRLRCLFLQHTACCLEFVFFLCPFVIADRKSQYRNTGQFASFSPLPQFLPVLSGRLGQGVLRNHSERVLFYFTKKRMGSDVLLCLKKWAPIFKITPGRCVRLRADFAHKR